MYGIEERWLSTQGTVDKIMQAITDKTPFSLVRIQDGEYRLIEWDNVSLGDLETILWVHFGRQSFPDRYVKFISEGVIKAAQNADIVGLFRGPLVVAPTDGEYRRILFSAIRRQMIGVNAHVVNADIHNSLLVEDHFKALLTGLPFLGLVTCRPIGGAVKNAFGIGDVRTFMIPEQSQFASNRQDLYNERPHFPDAFFGLQGQIQVPFPGAVFLVGAGMLGKLYCDLIKQRGGIAIDVGSVFDAWDGIMSRAQFSGGNIYNEIDPKMRLHDRRDYIQHPTRIEKAQWAVQSAEGEVTLVAASLDRPFEATVKSDPIYVGAGPIGGAPMQTFEGREDLRQKLKMLPNGATLLRTGYTRNIGVNDDALVHEINGRIFVDSPLIGQDLNANVSASASGKVYASAEYADALQEFTQAELVHEPVRFRVNESCREFWLYCDYEVLRPVNEREFATAVSMQLDDDDTSIAVRCGMDGVSQNVIIYGGDHAVAAVSANFGKVRRYKILMAFSPKMLAVSSNGHLFQPQSIAGRRANVGLVVLGSYHNGAHALGGRIHAFGFGNGTISRDDMIRLTS